MPNFFFKISFWFIEMLDPEAQVIKKFFVIELSVPSLVYIKLSVPSLVYIELSVPSLVYSA